MVKSKTVKLTPGIIMVEKHVFKNNLVTVETTDNRFFFKLIFLKMYVLYFYVIIKRMSWQELTLFYY